MSPRFLIFVALVGCDTIGHTANGEWEGICVLDSHGTYEAPSEVEFELDVFEEDGKVRGDGEFFFNDYEFEGRVRGDRYDDFVELELEGSSNGHSTRLELSGDIIGNRVSGWCSFYGVEGELQMSR